MPPRTSTEAAWRAWWEALPVRMVGIHLEQLAREAVDVGPYNLFSRIEPRLLLRYDSSGFASLADIFDLQELCRRHWPAYQRSWTMVGGEEMALTGRLHERVQRLSLNRLV